MFQPKELTSYQKDIIEKHIKNFKELTKKNEEMKENKKPQIIEPKKISRTKRKQIKQ